MLGKVILITGATSGIGYKTAEYLAAQGNIVYGAGRRIESLENIKQVNPLKLDLTNEASIKTAIDTIIANEGRIDVLVNNAGYGSYGAIEDVTIEEAKQQFEVNIWFSTYYTARFTTYESTTIRTYH